MQQRPEVRKAMLIGQEAKVLWIPYHTVSRDAIVAVLSKPFPVPIRMPVMLTYLGFLLALLFYQEVMETTTLAVSINYQFLISLLSLETSNPML